MYNSDNVLAFGRWGSTGQHIIAIPVVNNK